jgi:NAD(P)-binding Rossmann-like domain
MNFKYKKYDFVIVGAGPSGLTTAWLLSKYGYSSLIIEKESTIGGCHRVIRVNNKFTEHGPRVYSSTYQMFITLLNDMGIDFYNLFTEYNFSISSIGQTSINNMSFSELYHLFIAYLRILFNPSYGKEISMATFMNQNNFTEKTKDYIDRLCRLTDGADSKKYTLFQFLQLFNQQILYKLYQPNAPNDEGLFKHMYSALMHTNKIDILCSHNVIKINSIESSIESIDIVDIMTKQLSNIKTRNLILAIPPKPLVKLINHSRDMLNPFTEIKDLDVWAEQNSYFDYITITYHWNSRIMLPKTWGFPKSDWGVVFIVLSDYFKDNNMIISTAITLPDKISNHNKKTANQCSRSELIKETFQQLKLSFPQIQEYDHGIISPTIYFADNKWRNKDTAFVITPNAQYIKSKSSVYTNLYTIGTHNGNSLYNFTSLESAVSNAFKFIHTIIPESKIMYPIKQTTTFNSLLIWGIILIIMILIMYYFIKK